MPSRLSSRLIRRYDRVGKVGVSEADRDGFEGKWPSPWNLELRHSGFLERTKTAMEGLAESAREQPAMPRFEDGSVNLRELIRRIAEGVVTTIMDAEADQLCAGGANGRNGYRERNLVTCVSQHDDRGVDASLGEDRGDCSLAVSFESKRQNNRVVTRKLPDFSHPL